MPTYPINNRTNQDVYLQVSTNGLFGLLMDIQIIGMQPHGERMIRAIAKDARDIIVMRAMNKEHAGESQKRKNVLRSLLQGITIVPMNATRIFLQSTDYDLLAQFFGTDYYLELSFFRLDPAEIAFLEKRAFGEAVSFEEGLQCWTRDGKNGRYVHCVGGTGGGDADRGRDEKGERSDTKEEPQPTPPPARDGGQARPHSCENCRPIDTRPGGKNGPKVSFDPGIKNNVNADLAHIIEAVARGTGKNLNISSMAGGDHAKDSDHYQGKAVDINRIDGVHVQKRSKDGKTKADVDAKTVQDAFGAYGSVEKNYGPAYQKEYKKGKWEPAPKQGAAHQNHIHISIR
ncbi:MAG: hypothetical protein H7837_14270 [Magnetococcus sp. MYC-9]